jgi:hypothetical protein
VAALAAWLVPAALSAGLMTWGLFLASRAYDPSAYGAQFWMTYDHLYYLDILTRLPAGMDSLAVLGLVLAGATGLGALALRPLSMAWEGEADRWFFAVAAGMALVSFATVGLGFAGLLRFPVYAALLGLGLSCFVVEAGLAARRAAGSGRLVLRRPATLNIVLVGLLVAFAYTALLFALTPVVQYDARWYHLAVPRHFTLAGRIYDIVRSTRIAGAGLTPYEEMLYTAILTVSGQVTAKLLNWALAVLTALLLVHVAAVHLRSVRTGLLAALVFLSTPLLVWSAATADNDLPLPFLTLLTVHAFLRWRAGASPRWLVLAALSAGYSIGVKVFGVFTVGLLLGGVAWVTLVERREGVRPLAKRAAALAAIALAMCLPWMAYAYVLTGDPVFPYLGSLFPTPYWGPATTAWVLAFIHSFGPDPSVRGLLLLPWYLAMHGERFRGVLGPVYLAVAPLALALLARRSNGVLRLVAVFTAIWVVGWFATGLLEDRYLEAVLPLLALLLAAGVVMPPLGSQSGRLVLSGVGVAIALAGVAMSNQLLVPITAHAADQNVDGRAIADWDYLYRGKPIDAVGDNATIDWLNHHLDRRTDKVYDGVLLDSEYLYSDIELYNGADWNSPAWLGQWRLTDPDGLSHLRTEHITYVLVAATDGPATLASPLGRHLREVQQPNGDMRLFHVEPD